MIQAGNSSSNQQENLKMQYEIEADWSLLTSCNFRCDYCFLSDTALGAAVPKTVRADDWIQAFSLTNKRWMLHITGGEPFLYPDFVSMCVQLSQEHYLSLNSNLSRTASVLEFAKRVAPSRVHYINAALHWSERINKGSLQSFVDSVLNLNAAGHAVFVSLVMTHETINLFPSIRDQLLKHNLYPAPKVARGATRTGDFYPKSYSTAEKALLSQYIQESREFYSPMLERMDELPTINVFLDDIWLNGVPKYYGRLCTAGSKFVSIEWNGEVVRCGTSSQSLGNLLEGTFSPLEEVKKCDTRHCPYYCEKFSIDRSNSEQPNTASIIDFQAMIPMILARRSRSI